jgi:ketosteroid isomerase-like protein
MVDRRSPLEPGRPGTDDLIRPNQRLGTPGFRQDRRRNVEVLRNYYDALNRGDPGTALELCDPDGEAYVATEPGADAVHRGRRRIASYLEAWLETWDEYHPEPEEFIEAGDRVAVYIQLRAWLRTPSLWLRGKDSRWEIEERVADVFTLRDGKITQLRFYVERDKALDAVGSRR